MLMRILRSMAAAGFAAGVISAAAPLALADSTISTQGPDSGVTVSSSNSTTVTNNNDVTVTNSNSQYASSGNATVSNNTTGGNATSGNATNNNSTSTSVAIMNSAPAMPSGGGGSVSTEGPNSPVYLDMNSYTRVTNNNNVYITNENYQTAETGNASVKHNTTGGNATSGNATNNNNTSTSISINNGGSKEGGGQGGGSGGGSNNGGGQGGAGQVLGAVFTAAASLGGGMGAAQLPNTGLHEGMSPWTAVTIFTLLASAAYWRLAISPKLR